MFKSLDQYKNIAGVDEVGRGALAGPVVAAAVILPLSFDTSFINDSKKLRPAQRRAVEYELYKNDNVCIGIGIVDNVVIDEINIREASLKAMYKAVLDLPYQPDYVLVDGIERIPALKIKQRPIIHGDALNKTIGAASIIAKCLRDRLMEHEGRKFPGYDLQRNKGYGTVAHLAGLKVQGTCPLHRQTYKPVKKAFKLYQEDI